MEYDSPAEHDEDHVLLHPAGRNPSPCGELDTPDLHLIVLEQHGRVEAIWPGRYTAEIESHETHDADPST